MTQHLYNDNTIGHYCQPLCYPLFDLLNNVWAVPFANVNINIVGNV